MKARDIQIRRLAMMASPFGSLATRGPTTMLRRLSDNLHLITERPLPERPDSAVRTTATSGIRSLLRKTDCSQHLGGDDGFCGQ